MPWGDANLSHKYKGKIHKLFESIEIRERLTTLFPKIGIKRKRFLRHNIYRDETLVNWNPKVSKDCFQKIERIINYNLFIIIIIIILNTWVLVMGIWALVANAWAKHLSTLKYYLNAWFECLSTQSDFFFFKMKILCSI